MRIDSSGNVGIGATSPDLFSFGSTYKILTLQNTATNANAFQFLVANGTGESGIQFTNQTYRRTSIGSDNASNLTFATNGTNSSATGLTERARITSGGQFFVAKTVSNFGTAGFRVDTDGSTHITAESYEPLSLNRLSNDGTLVAFFQAGTVEGSISVSGSTVSYNGGHLSRWAQMLTKPDLLKGTVMSNLDEMNLYVDADGNPVENEQLNKVKVSDVEGDANVAGVFVNWTYDEAHQVDEINMAMTGDMIIRIAQGTTVARGDLLMSAGDGTAKPQGDDIVRSKTIAKVTSTHVTCTYDDGSYCVPCVLMAC
jgi:hypothetical protein